MHAGLTGMLVYGATVGFILSVIDGYSSKGLSVNGILALLIVPFYNLFTSADLTTSLLTHGLAFSIVMLSLLSSTGRTAR
jgi:hypothetical protein